VTAGLGVVIFALWAADAGTKALPDRLVLNAGACPTPEEGSFKPGGGNGLVRELLLPDDGITTILQVVVIPAYGPVHALRLETPNAPSAKPAGPRLRLVQSTNDFWYVVRLVNAGDARGVARARKKIVTARFQPVDPELVALLEDVWAGALARTQYVTEVLEARRPDGSRTIVHRGDGEERHLWYNRRSGNVTEAPEGSALGDLTAVQELLVQYVLSAPERQAVPLKQIKSDLVRLRMRLATNESCVSATVHATGTPPR
jgi:hypothetical protein